MNAGYVVVRFNQAGGTPHLMFNGDVYDREVDAVEDAEGEAREWRANGRVDTFAVARLEIEHEIEPMEAVSQ